MAPRVSTLRVGHRQPLVKAETKGEQSSIFPFLERGRHGFDGVGEAQIACRGPDTS